MTKRAVKECSVSIACQIILTWFVISPFIAAFILCNTGPRIVIALFPWPYVGLALYALLWSLMRGTTTTKRRTDIVNLDAYETAYVAGGEKRAVDAAITRLVHRRVLALDINERRLRWGDQKLENPHPLEQAVYSAIDPEVGQCIDAVRSSVWSVVDQTRERLVELGLILSGWRAQILGFLFFLVFLCNILIGDVYLYGALGCFEQSGLDEWFASANFLLREVGQLFLTMLVVTGFCLIVVLPTGAMTDLMKSDRSRAGDRALQAMKKHNESQRLIAGWNVDEVGTDDQLITLALSDKGARVQGALAEIWNMLDSPGTFDADDDCDSDGGGSAADGFDAFGD